MFITALFTKAETWNQPKYPSMIDWIKEICYLYTMEYYPTIKKNEIMCFTGTWMELEAIILSKLMQEQKAMEDRPWRERIRKNNLRVLGLIPG